MDYFSQQFKAQRDKAHLTQTAVATALHVEPQTVADWELGKSYPDYEMLVNISNLYQISIDELLKDDEQSNKLISRSKAKKAFDIGISFSWLLCGLFNYYQATVVSQDNLASELINVLVGLLMVIAALYQLKQGSLFDGISKSERNKEFWPIWRDPVAICLIILFVVPLIISAFTSDFISAIIRGTVFMVTGIVEIGLAINVYHLDND